MADVATEIAATPLPPKGQIVSTEALYQTQISLYRNSIAFGGNRNPSSIWATLVYNHPQTMAYLRELEDKDEDVSNALDTLRLSVLGRDRNIEPGDDSQLALDARDFIKDQLDELDFHTVLDCILDAPGYGFSVQEMIFDTSEGQASLVGIDDCPQELFLFGDRYQPQIGPMQLLPQPWASTGALVPEEKFIIFTYRKRSRNRMGRPLLKSVFWPSWFKRNVQRLWMQYAEKGPGTAVVHYNDPNSATEKQQAVDIAQAIVENTAIAVPNGFSYDKELLTVARAQDPAIYEKFFSKMQYSITRRIMGETLTSFGNEGGGGSKAQGDTHADTLDQRSIELCMQLASTINRQAVRPLVRWNFGPDAPLPKLKFDVEEAEDTGDRLEIDTGLQKMGKQFSVGYIADRYDVPITKEENPDDVLKSAGPVVPPLPVPPPVKLPSGAFSESEAERQARQELGEFDDLFSQLKLDVTGLLKERVEEIAESATPVTVHPAGGNS